MGKDKLYDLCIVADATASMSTFLQALNASLPQILDLSLLTDAFASISVLAYRDYCDKRIIEWSGWTGKGDKNEECIDYEQLISFSSSIRAEGGGDEPEAAKTAVYELVKHLHSDRKTVVIWYADAPPHLDDNPNESYLKDEVKALNRFGGDALRCLDWISACKTLSEKNVQVFPIITSRNNFTESSYCILARLTGGRVLKINSLSQVSISNSTVNLLLHWMGIQNFEVEENFVGLINLDTKDNAKIDKLQSEKEAKEFFLRGLRKIAKDSNNTEEIIPSLDKPLDNFYQRFTSDENYKRFAMGMLAKIIKRDVTTISLNPVFGSLWRAACSDRMNEDRMALINEFSLAVSKISDEDSKKRMRTWLEESYDNTEEIILFLESIPKEEMYPAVYIDYTVAEVGPKFWKREDLLEISRSCNATVLKRLTKVLTSLTYIPDESCLPVHLKIQSNFSILPLSLLEKKYGAPGKSFWNLLLHLVLPGTVLSQRPSSLLAGLCFSIEVPFLKEKGLMEITGRKGTWVDVETPENWSPDFIRLLLSIDEKATEFGGILDESERKLFSNLYHFRALEVNLSHPVNIMIGHTPSKSYAPIGPLRLCTSCGIRRSITIMATENKCGICSYGAYESVEIKQKYKSTGAVLDDNAENTKACWVECRVSECRAQYVVYNVDALNVEPKCHYCRFNQPCPFVTCTQCLNRMVYPVNLRSKEKNYLKNWRCGFCIHELPSIVEETTTVEKLRTENGEAWLQSGGGKLTFEKKSIFSIAQNHDLKLLEQNLSILPHNPSLILNYRSKQIHNTKSIIENIKSIISSGKLYKNRCSLCFEDFRPDLLARACGRKGCHQVACSTCLVSWYGQNAPGKILNLMTLNCPFCRRRPSGKTVRNFSPNIRGIIGFDAIVDEQDEWIHAWCVDCGSAKRLMQRECAREYQEVNNWACEDCIQKRLDIKDSSILENIRECPGCTVTTEKFAGCHHITCPCGVHWCWVCRFQASTADEVYSHLVEVHGGIFNFYDHDSDVED